MSKTFIEGENLADLLKFEAENLYSRDVVIVEAGHDLPLGCVVGRIQSSNRIKAFDPSATDGAQVPIGVLIQHADATLAEVHALIVSRHAVVASNGIKWPTTLTVEEKADAVRQLKDQGVLIRASA